MGTKIKLRRKVITSILLAIAALLSGSPANSTTLIRMSVAQLAHAAQLVVRARCIANSTAWDRGEIWTFTSFAVDETWKSARNPNSNEYLTVRLLGGIVGNLTSNVSGVPRFSPGEEVILFLEPNSSGDFSVVSWIQGTFRIRRDLRTNRQIAVQDTASFDTFEPATHQFQSSGLRQIPVDDLHSLVKSANCAAANCAPQGTK